MTRLFCLFAFFALLSGCAVYTPSGAVVIGDPSPVVVKEGGGGGGFCPPGQAKKGRC